MAQAYISTYKRNFRHHPIHPRKDLKPYNTFAETLPQDGNWIIKENIWDNKESMDAAIEEVRKMYLRRYVTTYQNEYCKKKIDADKEEQICENILLEYCRKLFADSSQPILPPLPSARILFGYMSPKEFYIKRSTYQDVHGRLAFNILENSYGNEIKSNSDYKLQRANAATNLIAVDSLELLRKTAKYAKNRRNAIAPITFNGTAPCICLCKKC